QGGLDAGSLDVVLRRHPDGAALDQPLSPGDRIVVELDNCAADALYVHVFTVEPHGAIRRLTSDAALGILVPSHAHHTLGGAAVGVAGIPVRWPERLPPLAVRDIEIVAIAATRPCDLGFLERRTPDPSRVVRDVPRLLGRPPEAIAGAPV